MQKTRKNKFGNNFISILSQMKSCLPFSVPILENSLVIFMGTDIFHREDWQKLGENFQNLISGDETRTFQNELNRMGINYERYRKEINTSKIIFEMWNNLSLQYPLMSRLAKAVFVFSHSSALIKLIFPQMQDFFKAKRNRLTIENIESCLLIRV